MIKSIEEIFDGEVFHQAEKAELAVNTRVQLLFEPL